MRCQSCGTDHADSVAESYMRRCCDEWPECIHVLRVHECDQIRRGIYVYKHVAGCGCPPDRLQECPENPLWIHSKSPA